MILLEEGGIPYFWVIGQLNNKMAHCRKKTEKNNQNNRALELIKLIKINHNKYNKYLSSCKSYNK